MWYIYVYIYFISSLFKSCIEKFLGTGNLQLTQDPRLKAKKRRDKRIKIWIFLHQVFTAAKLNCQIKICPILRLLPGNKSQNTWNARTHQNTPEHPTQAKVSLGLVLWWSWVVSGFSMLFKHSVLVLVKIIQDGGLNCKQ